MQDTRTERKNLRVLELLKEGAATTREVASKLHISRPAAAVCLRVMSEATPKRVYVSGWKRTGGRAFKLYSPGDAPDVEFIRRRQQKRPKPADPYKAQCDGILAALAKPQTVAELAADVGASVSYVRKFLTVLKARKQVYVCDWQPSPAQGAMAKVYAVGNKPDKKKKVLTHAERFQQLKADKDRYAEALARRSACRMVQRVRRTQNNWFSALMGA